MAFVLVSLTVLIDIKPAAAYFLDAARNFDVRLRAYAQMGILTTSSEKDLTTPIGIYRTRIPTRIQGWQPGNVGQQRNFYNPEFDARLTDFMQWAGKPDEVKFRFAWWGFYDGLYDYGTGPWDNNLRVMQGRFSQSANHNAQSFTFQDQNKRPRRIYASRNRINELYMDYTKGPAFFRIGRQSISWGESDSIALHDIQNPFDLTLGAPGFFQDTEEARIPLYTARGTFKLIDNWKFLSSAFVDAYLVPGPIDTTVPINPIVAGISPFNPQQADPQWIIGDQKIPYPVLFGGNAAALHSSVVDELPENNWGNSRWGVRLAGILFGDYTTQVWFYRTFNQAPMPQIIGPGIVERATKENNPLAPTQIDNRGWRTPVCNGVNVETGAPGVTPAGRRCNLAFPNVTLLRRRLESVVGVASSWYSEPLNGIIRAQAQFFDNELAFLPKKNLNPRVQLPAAVIGKEVKTSAPTADYLRWVIAYDRFFFFRPLNPTNSFVLVSSFNSEFNLSEKGGRDYRWPNTKPDRPAGGAAIGAIPGNAGCPGGAETRNNPLCVRVNPHSFEDRYQYEAFFQFALQSDYMHGRLSPRVVAILDISGIYAFAPSLNYRVNDNLLLGATWLTISGKRRAGLGTFRSSDMVQVRMTFQIN
jgi:hypothetical protein